MDPSFTAVCAQLGVTGLQLLALMANPAFPAPSSGSGMTASWASGPAASFATLWAAVLANGWKVSDALKPTAPLTLWSTTTPGPYYSPALVDPLFDNFRERAQPWHYKPLMTARDRWTEKLKCPVCGLEGTARLSQLDGWSFMSDQRTSVDECPRGFEPRNDGENGIRFFCTKDNVAAKTTFG